jgi:hypothetical protein
VVNPRQAGSLLAAVTYVGRSRRDSASLLIIYRPLANCYIGLTFTCRGKAYQMALIVFVLGADER